MIGEEESAVEREGWRMAPELMRGVIEGLVDVRFQIVSVEEGLRRVWASATPMLPRPKRVMSVVAMVEDCRV